MITGELKNKIDSLWDIFAAGGLVNPLEVIEQITYLMFIHDLDDSDNMRAKMSHKLSILFFNSPVIIFISNHSLFHVYFVYLPPPIFRIAPDSTSSASALCTVT